MRALLFVWILASCRYDGGRFTGGEIDAPSGDAETDEMVDTLMVGCEGHWKMDEADWSGGVIDSCGGVALASTTESSSSASRRASWSSIAAG